MKVTKSRTRAIPSACDDEAESVNPGPTAAVDACDAVAARRDESVSVMKIVSEKCLLKYHKSWSNLPRSSSGISVDLALATCASQDLDAVYPRACSQIEAEDGLAHACVEGENAAAFLAATLAEKLTAAVFVAKLDSVEAGAVVDLDTQHLLLTLPCYGEDGFLWLRTLHLGETEFAGLEARAAVGKLYTRLFGSELAEVLDSVFGAGTREEIDLQFALLLVVGQSIADRLFCERDLPWSVAITVCVFDPMVANIVAFREYLDPCNAGGSSCEHCAVNSPYLNARVEVWRYNVGRKPEASVVSEAECIEAMPGALVLGQTQTLSGLLGAC